MRTGSLACALFVVALAATSVGLAAEADKPNFLFVIADDCTYRDLGCYGGQAHTPNIDRLASEGMRFTQCFQAAPMCSPTRHNIYTGLYPVKSGAYPNHTFARRGTKSVVHYLKPLGYRVALSGKRHINPPEVFPFENLPAVGKNPDFERIDAFMAECKADATPFCLFACSNEPHSPWNNLADDPDHAQIKAELRAELLAWMEAMGDRGQATELEALERQTRALRAKGKTKPKRRDNQKKREQR